MVGDEHQLLARLGIPEADPLQWLRIDLFDRKHSQRDHVVADHPGAAVGLAPRRVDFAHHRDQTLCEEHDEKLLQASEALDLVFALAAGDAATKRQRQMRGQVCKNQFSSVPASLGAEVQSALACRNCQPNRDQRK